MVTGDREGKGVEGGQIKGEEILGLKGKGWKMVEEKKEKRGERGYVICKKNRLKPL